MGRAARWLRGILGGGKKAGSAAPPPPSKEKKRWTFSRTFNEDRRGPCGEGSRACPAAAVDAPPPVSDGDEQSKHAIAVAAATAAVAEAAVAAAQAAAVVVRLTSSGRSASAPLGLRGTKTEEFAAVKIQSAFRGYLARRALRALKGLVRLQALVRGNIVRKQATETLRCMQALVRVQARARARRALCPENAGRKRSSSPHPQGPPTPEKYEAAIRGKGLKSDRLRTLKKDFSRPVNVEPFEQDSVISYGWNWLDRWMEERYSESRVSAKSMMGSGFDEDKNAKVLEVDSGKPRYNAKRGSNYYYSCSTLASDPNSHSFATVQDSPSKDSTIAQLSIPSPSSVDMQQSLSPQRFVMEAVELAESPQFYSASSSRPGSSRRGPFTPSKSECSRSLFSGYSDYPNYMANTQSSRAKTRSQSAPKQRPEFEKSGSLKRSSHHHGYGHQPGSSVATQKSSSLHAKFANKAYPGSGRLDRLGMPLRT